MVTVLVADDDDTVREVVVAYLHRAGFPTLEARDGLQAVSVVGAEHPQLVVLDVMLPGIDGFEALRRMREIDPRLPVLMLTARTTEEDRIYGLEIGADDYVVKPFSARELVLRVQALLRRVSENVAVDAAVGSVSGSVRDGDLVADPAARSVQRGGQRLALTGREFDLLIFLMSHPGVVLTREDLLRQVWGWDFGDDSTVTVHIRRLRNKVEVDPAHPQRVVTVWGSGYRWDRQQG
ncbi:MAG: response regulator transcription factor [Ornithinimicrobium sp.]